MEHFEVTLPPEIDTDDLTDFLEKYFPYNFLVSEEDGKVFVNTPAANGLEVLNKLLPHYWSIDLHEPQKFFKFLHRRDESLSSTARRILGN